MKSTFIVLLAGAVSVFLVPASAAGSSPREGIPEIRRIAVIGDAGGERLFRSPVGLARDGKTGELAVSNFESEEVVLLDRGGAPVTRIGRDAGLVTPYGVAFDAKGRIIVGELRKGTLKLFSAAGSLTDEIDLSRALDRTVSPGRIAIGTDNRIYVADLSGNEILVLNEAGDLVRKLGPFRYLQKTGPAEGGMVIGLSAHGKAVTVFDSNGTPLRSFGEHGDELVRNVSFPTGFAVDGKGRIWIADAFQHRLKVFSLDGAFLFNFGRLEETTESGGFFFPVDLCFGDKGELFVLEKGAERIQVFRVGDLGE